MNPHGDHADEGALATLLHPFAIDALAWPASRRVLFLRARDGMPLGIAPRERMVCEQDFKPHADALHRAGFHGVAHADETFPLVLLLPPRQKDEARAELARAVSRVEPGGMLVAAAGNNEGARSHEADLRRLLGEARSQSKHHGRVYWANVREAALDRALLDEWSALDAPRPIAEGHFISRPGVFAWDRIDAASALLAAHLPFDLQGRGADLGAGWGYLANEVLARCADVTSLDLYEASARALELARHNMLDVHPARGAPASLHFHWHDVTAGLPHRYDFIVTNPPFHVGRADEPQLGRAFIAAAAAALAPRGRLWLVANRHLPYESELKERFASVHCVADARGFKVIEAVRSGA